jgi:Meiotically up-regulated gene 113
VFTVEWWRDAKIASETLPPALRNIKILSRLKRELRLRAKKRVKVKSDGYLYIIRTGRYYKIGVTTHPSLRIKEFETNNPLRVEVLLQHYCFYYQWLERCLHKRFETYQVKGEWFRLKKHQVMEIKDFIAEIEKLLSVS